MIDQPGMTFRRYMPQVKGQILLRKTKVRYLGSVRFFKHLIVCALLLMVVVPWILVAYLMGERDTWMSARQREYQLGIQAIRQLESEESHLAQVSEQLKNALERNEELSERAAQDGEEILVLRERLMLTATLYQFHEAYGHLHPQLRVEGPSSYIDSTGVVYLTFDDGPGPYTASVLDILARYDIKATFFLVGSMIDGRERLLERMMEEGHTIGIHTYSHVYRTIYESLEAYLEDFAKVSDKIETVTGRKPDIFRFPGGSVNGYNERTRGTIINETLARGYRYYDWNVGSGDAYSGNTVDQIVQDTLRQVRNNTYGVVLMHDGGSNRGRTVEALPRIINTLIREGYRFESLTNEVKPTVFTYGSQESILPE